MNEQSTPTRGSWPRALWAGFLSLVFPGLGQIYAGFWRLGIGLYLIAFGFPILALVLTWTAPPTQYSTAIFVLAALLYAIFRLIIIIDAARRIRRGLARRVVAWHQSTWFAGAILLAIMIAFGVGIFPEPQFGWRSFSIPSASNLPTLVVGDYVMADVRQPGVTPTYGDMAIFRLPRSSQVAYIKRVVGLPGDRVQMKQGILYLNDKAIPRQPTGSYSMSSVSPSANFKAYQETMPNGRTYTVLEKSDNEPGDNTDEYTVPPDSFFVLGDNRDNSLDSRLLRDFGYVPVTHMIGLAGTIFWSRDPFRLLSRVE